MFISFTQTQTTFLRILALTSMAGFSVSNSALAQQDSFQQQDRQDDQIEEEVERIIVTADLGLRDLSQLPSSALILNQTSIENRQARHLQDIVSIVPNLNFAAGASRGKFIQIRGIGERSQFSEPINPSIGLLLDDIDISGIGSLATIYDISQLEVLSGPQSVATGTNSLGGIVKIVSNAPSAEPYARLTFGYAQYNELQLSGVYSNGITDNLNMRVSVQQIKSDGFVDNAFLQRDDTNEIDELSLTAMFDYELSDNTKLDLKLYKFDIVNGYDAFSLDNDNITLSDEPGFDNVEASAGSIKLSHQFENHSLQASMFMLNADTDYGYDEDWTFTGFHPDGYTSFDRYTRAIERSGLDVKWASNQETAHQYLLGVNLSSHDEDLTRSYTFLDNDYSSNYKPQSQSIFGQYIYAINDTVNITTALRVEQFDAEFEDNDGFTAVLDDSLVGASIAVDYHLAGNLLFANVSRGYKAGGFNIDQRLTDTQRVFSPEYNFNYEVGLKGRAYDDMVDLSLTFFYMDREDAQVSDFAIFPNPDAGDSFADVIGNAGSGVNKGAEIASTWDVSEDWYIQANIGFLDAYINDYRKIDGSLVLRDEQAQAPDYTAYISSTWLLSEQLTWFIDVESKDDFRFSDGHIERADATSVINTELTWQPQSVHNYSIKLWIKNVTDETVYTRGFGGFSNDPRDGYANPQPYYQFGQPRQIGVTLNYEWE